MTLLPYTGSRSPSLRRRLGLGLVLLLALALRLHQLGAQSLWYDETVSAYLASQDLIALTRHTAGDIHPPLYYYLLHIWARLAGDSEFALAFVSLFCGMLLVAMAYRLGTRLIDPPTGMLAAAITALSPFHIWYSQEVRMYTLGSLLAMLTLWALVRMRQDSRAWLAWALAAAAGLYSLYYFAFLLVFENLFVLGSWLRRRELATGAYLRRWLAAQATAAILYLPWLPIFYRQATDPPVPPWRSFTDGWTVLRETWSALVVGQSMTPQQAWPVLILAVVLYLVALGRGQARERTGLTSGMVKALLVGYTAVPMVLIWLLSFITPLYHVRYAFLYAAPFSIVLAWGMRAAWEGRLAVKRLAVAAAALALISASLFSFSQFWNDPRYAADDYRSAVRYIARRLGPNDAVLINAGYVYPAFLYYYRGPIAWRGRLTDYPAAGVDGHHGAVIVQMGTIDGPPNLGWGSPASDFYAIARTDAAAALERLFANHERVWMLRAYDTVTDPQGFVRAWLEAHGLLFDDWVIAGEANARVQGWRTHRAPQTTAPTPPYPLDVRFGAGIVRLLGFDGDLAPLAAGDDLPLSLYWRWEAASGSAAAIDYSVSVGLYNARGRRLAQYDEQPGAPLYPTSRWAQGEVMAQPLRLAVPLGTPPGTYTIEVTVYDPANGAPLSIVGTEPGSRARLGSIAVTQPAAWPRVAWPAIGQALGYDFGGQLRLARAAWPTDPVVAGDTLSFAFLWQAVRPPRADYQVVVRLTRGDGRAMAEAVHAPADGLHPTSSWLPGEVVIDHAALLVPGAIAAGRYDLEVGVRAPDGGWLGRPQRLGPLELHARAISTAIPPMAHRLDARLGESIRLLGYDLTPATPRPGDELTLTLYWQALAGVAESFKVFNHLIAPDGQIAAQRDGYPADGRQPTSGWVAGEVISDVYRIAIPADAPPGRYRLFTGMYREADFSRLPAFDRQGQPLGDAILLTEVEVDQ